MIKMVRGLLIAGVAAAALVLVGCNGETENVSDIEAMKTPKPSNNPDVPPVNPEDTKFGEGRPSGGGKRGPQ